MPDSLAARGPRVKGRGGPTTAAASNHYGIVIKYFAAFPAGPPYNAASAAARLSPRSGAAAGAGRRGPELFRRSHSAPCSMTSMFSLPPTAITLGRGVDCLLRSLA